MIHNIKSQLERSAPTRYNRILHYMYSLKKHIEINNKQDQENIENIEIIINRIISKVKIYSRINIILYLAIYFSFISFFFSDIFILSELSILISKIISAFGTTIFIIGIYFSNKIIELYYQDLNLITSHLISIYTKYEKENFDESPQISSNYYKVFIEFFAKRYGDI
ncbi:MAG: hypothetical protein ACOC16_02010 [Nanoarchaeota archaeon]